MFQQIFSESAASAGTVADPASANVWDSSNPEPDHKKKPS